jgi:hypothetical protein
MTVQRLTWSKVAGSASRGAVTSRVDLGAKVDGYALSRFNRPAVVTVALVGAARAS